MIKKKLRLASWDFKSHRFRSVENPYFNVRVRPNHLAHNRFGVIISNKVDKRSAKRNQLRRRLLDGVSLWPNLGLDLVLVSKPKLIQLNPSQIKAELEKALPALQKETTL